MAAPCALFFLGTFCLFLVIFQQSLPVWGHGQHDETSVIPHLNMAEISAVVQKRKEVMVFIHKENCGQNCEQHIDSIEEAMVEVQMMGNHKNIHIVASTDEAYFKHFQIRKNIILAFYRKGVPILYEAIKEDSLLPPENLVQWVADTRGRFVQHLTDDTFEHDTQAASGATTGDWFVMFYQPGCYEKFIPKLETLNYRVRDSGKVIAKVDVTQSKEMEKRFQITKCPTFYLFRAGKMYEYEQQKYDVDSLYSFVTNFYKNAKSKKVPLERSPFDLITEYAVNFLKRQHGVKEKIALASVATLIAVIVLVRLTKPGPKIQAKQE